MQEQCNGQSFALLNPTKEELFHLTAYYYVKPDLILHFMNSTKTA